MKDNKTCRNCGKELNGIKKCPYCGAVNFQDPIEYSDFTTKKISSKKIIIIASVLLISIIIIVLLTLVIGKKVPIVEHDDYSTDYINKAEKCKKATCDEFNKCTYINDSGVVEELDCSKKDYYN